MRERNDSNRSVNNNEEIEETKGHLLSMVYYCTLRIGLTLGNPCWKSTCSACHYLINDNNKPVNNNKIEERIRLLTSTS